MSDIGEERLELSEIAITQYGVLYREFERRGYTTDPELMEELENWYRYEEYLEWCEMVRAQWSDRAMRMDSPDIDVVRAAVDEHNEVILRYNELLMDFMEIDSAELDAMVAGEQPDYPEPDTVSDPGSGVYEFSTANISMIGDTAAVDDLRFRLQSIQGLYDAIATHVANLNFDLARRNAENLYSSLETAGDDAARLSGECSFTVRFTGLPTDEAMARYNELEKNREENHLFYQNVVQRIDEINDAIEERDRALINSVCTAACESFMSWSSLPEWYEIPRTFREWHQQSQEHAGEIEDIMDFIRSLGEMRAELERIKDESMDYHEEMIQEMSDLEPVLGLHAELERAMSSMGWASYTPGW
ncbi:hypothetical protein GF402_01545 [Candidatus Fermentibacteria bacterium]|nr:hypothetical protein [Candidatus Fermentibacteria bacterium]